MQIYEELKWRGLIQDETSPEIKNILNNQKISFYLGTDPTADSIHLGHYCLFLLSKRLAKAGHTPVILVGGATALVGDPRGSTERELAEKTLIENNFKAIKKQMQSLFPYEVVNNYDWIKDISILDFLRDYGKYINVNYMLAKELVKRQLETGISFAEFAYMLIQAVDFLHLYQNKNVVMQVEGSDQWGNLTTGVELIRKLLGKEAYGFVIPLITDSHGNKFGKSEGNALWVDKNKTSPYELYQYLYNREDEVVINYLKKLTFLSKTEIQEIEKMHNAQPHLRFAQKELAKQVTTDIHGKAECDNAIKISENLFSGNIKEIAVKDLLIGLKSVPSFKFCDANIVDILTENKICSSKREAREFIKSKAVWINGEVVADETLSINKNHLLENQIIIIRIGKKKYYIGHYNN